MAFLLTTHVPCSAENKVSTMTKDAKTNKQKFLMYSRSQGGTEEEEAN